MHKKLITVFNESMAQFRSTEHIFMVIIAVIIGVLGGLGAVGIQYLIKVFTQLFWGTGNLDLEYLRQVPYYLKIAIPTGGAFLVGLIVYFFAPEAKGHGVPEVMEAIALRDGRIRPRVAVAKLFASSICIASGGSVGREGPVIQIGSSIGSTVGQFLKVNAQRTKVFVACGAAAGIAAAFNAPMAGALFSVEIILADFGVAQFSPIVISSVMATVVSRHFLGNFPAFEVPAYHLVSPIELIPYAILGLLSGLVALLFIQVLSFSEDFFDDHLKLPGVVKTVIGGFLLGCFGLLVPGVYGVGYNSMNMALLGQLSWVLMLGLVFAKIIATSLSLGSGGSGGIFAPSLFIGTMTGGFFGSLVHMVMPSMSASSGAYAMVGMGAVVAAATHAPITAILIIFEMTNDYKIILPLMISTIIATLLAIKLKKESIYTIKLVGRGVDLFRGRELNVLRSLKVADFCDDKPKTIAPGLGFRKLLELVVNYPNASYYLVNEQKKFFGVVSLQEVRQAILEQDDLSDLLVAADLATTGVPSVTMNGDLDQVMKLFGHTDHRELPILDPDSGELVGAILQREVTEAYNREIVKRSLGAEISSSVQVLDKVEEIDLLDGYVMAEVQAPVTFVGQSLRSLDVRSRLGLQVMMFKRREQKEGEVQQFRQLIPGPDEIVQDGDRLVVLGLSQDVDVFRNM
ncbi:MAG: chloride channel protein [Deltaproteobacteria bacterium]|nr:chloride channel protein [Candidatus Tharpella aukensis]